MSETHARPQDVYELIEVVRIGMLVTAREEGSGMRARPMAAHVKAEEDAIYFLTDVEGRKDDEVQKEHHVCLAFSDPKSERYASVSGLAAISNDRDKIRELFSMAAKAWWDSPEDPSIRLVRVTPREAEIWKGPGRVVSMIKMAAAAATGGRPDLGENAKVKMD